MHNLNGISTTRDIIFREDVHIYSSIWSIQPSNNRVHYLYMHIFSLSLCHFAYCCYFLCFIILLSFLQLFVCFNSTLNSNKVVKTIAPVPNKRPALKLMMQIRAVFSTFDSKIQTSTRINSEFQRHGNSDVYHSTEHTNTMCKMKNLCKYVIIYIIIQIVLCLH